MPRRNILDDLDMMVLDGAVIGGDADSEVDREAKTSRPETLDDGTEKANREK